MSHTRRLLAIVIFFLVAFSLNACNFPGVRATENPYPTFAAQTVEARLTLAVQDTPPAPLPQTTDTPSPTDTTEPEPTGTPTNTAIPTQTEVPCDRAAFVTDVTIPDGTVLGKSENFTKTWRLRNTGSCTWNSSYQLIFDEGDAMGGPASKQLSSGSVTPGQTVDVSVDLTAPNSEGDYRGDWLIRSDKGIVFGVGSGGDVSFYVEIEVGDPTATPVPVLITKKVDLQQTYLLDLDTGNVTSTGADIFFRAVSAVEKYFESRNGAEFKKMSGVPSLSDCQAASMSTVQIPLANLSAGDLYCYETNEGNIGRLEIEEITGGTPQFIKIDLRTWDT